MRALFGDHEERRLIEGFFGNPKSGFFVDVGAAESPLFDLERWRPQLILIEEQVLDTAFC
jgi:hypothetical protein